MILLIHIASALSSLLATSYLFFQPSKRNFRVTYSVIGLTLASGTYLVFHTHSNLLHACVTGLVYLGVVTFGLALAEHKKVIRQKVTIRSDRKY